MLHAPGLQSAQPPEECLFHCAWKQGSDQSLKPRGASANSVKPWLGSLSPTWELCLHSYHNVKHILSFGLCQDYPLRSYLYSWTASQGTAGSRGLISLPPPCMHLQPTVKLVGMKISYNNRFNEPELRPNYEQGSSVNQINWGKLNISPLESLWRI